MSTVDEACLQDEIAALRLTAWRAEDERDAERARLREVAQTLIERVGANGPMSALDAAMRTLAVLDSVVAERDAARAVLREAIEVLNFKRTDHPGWWAAWVERARTAAKGGER